MKTKTLSAMSMSTLYDKLVANPDAAFIAAQPEAELVALKVRCESHWTQSPWLLSWTVRFVIGFMAYLLFMGGFMIKNVVPLTTNEMILLLGVAPVLFMLSAGFVLTAVTFFTLDLFDKQAPERIAKALHPLKDAPYTCRALLPVLNDSPRARAYRDSVTAQGRELLVLDADAMMAEGDVDDEARQEAQNRDNCRRVHGFSVA
jgi:hypothetical protein